MTDAFVRPLLEWYEMEHRDLPWRRTRDPYCIWVSEIMLQQTRVSAVIGYYERFLYTLPTVQALAQAEESVYLKLWEGLGYYSRVRNLHKAACVIKDHFGGKIPGSYLELLTLPGIGEYTAGAIASIAFGERVPAVDGNVLRVIARLTNDKRPITDIRIKAEIRAMVAEVVPDGASGAFNQAMMELGAVVCLPTGVPKCTECPIWHLCQAYHAGTVMSLPMRASAKDRTLINRSVFLLKHHGKIALIRRPEKGLLGGMWELPAVEKHLSPAEAKETLRNWGVSAGQVLSLRPAKHVFTHIEWHMQGFYAETDGTGDLFTWVSPSEIRAAYALPSAFRSFMKVIEQDV